VKLPPVHSVLGSRLHNSHIAEARNSIRLSTHICCFFFFFAYKGKTERNLFRDGTVCSKASTVSTTFKITRLEHSPSDSHNATNIFAHGKCKTAFEQSWKQFNNHFTLILLRTKHARNKSPFTPAKKKKTRQSIGTTRKKEKLYQQIKCRRRRE
jgi:hypothetical protein